MPKLVFKVRSEARYSEANFPLKLRPLKDELLSSWLVRLALRHRTMPSTFTNLYLPETKNKLWSVDIDLQADPALLLALSQKSGIPTEVLLGMTLKSYEGYLLERLYQKNRATPFVNPLGMRGRRNTLPGMRYCPYCLRKDEQPYFRKKWRLSLSVVCLKHECFLLDRCPQCGIPITSYVSCKSGKLGVCHKCGKSIAETSSVSPAPSEVLTAIERFQGIVDDGYVVIDGMPVYSHLYFIVLHQILKLLMSRKHGFKLCKGVGLDFPQVMKGKTIELVLIRDQAMLLVKAVWLLDDWPERFVGVCKQQRIFSSKLLHDMNPPPFWFWKVVIECLYRPDRMLTDEEIMAAIGYMEEEGMVVTEAALSRLLGVRQVFRKRRRLDDFNPRKNCSAQ